MGMSRRQESENQLPEWWPRRHPNLRGDPKFYQLAFASRYLFAWKQAHRPLVVMIDDSLREVASRDGKTRYLFELLTEQSIQSSLYADEGPSDCGVDYLNAATDVRAFKDWAVIRVGDPDRLRVVSWTKDGKPTDRTTNTEDNSFDRVVRADPPTSYVLAGNPEERTLADAHAMLTAETIRADLYITARALPLQLGPEPSSPVTAVRPEIALPIVGLYLRRQRRFVLARSMLGEPDRPTSERVRDRHQFYWDAADLILRDSWRWRFASGAHARATGEDTLQLLQTAVIHRLAQVLEARDRLLAITSIEQNTDTQLDALGELEMILVWLMAAFDSAARVVHLMFLDRSEIKSAGWQKEPRGKRLRAKSPEIASLVADNTTGWHVMHVLSVLRNYIHGEALTAAGIVFGVGDHAFETFAALPKKDREAIVRSLEKLGGSKAWGLEEPYPKYGLHIQPGQFAERLLEYSVQLLNEIMTATPVEQLQAIAKRKNIQSAPIPISQTDQRLIWQLGLPSVPPDC